MSSWPYLTKILCLIGHISHLKTLCLTDHIWLLNFDLTNDYHIHQLKCRATAGNGLYTSDTIVEAPVRYNTLFNLAQSGTIWKGIWYSLARSSKIEYNLARFLLLDLKYLAGVQLKQKLEKANFTKNFLGENLLGHQWVKVAGWTGLPYKRIIIIILILVFIIYMMDFFPSAWRWQVFYHSSSSSQRSYNPFCNGRLKYIICCFSIIKHDFLSKLCISK